jgi:iron complex transport system substrate-binding protein
MKSYSKKLVLKKNIMRIMVMILIISSLAAIFTGCGANSASNGTSAVQGTQPDVQASQTQSSNLDSTTAAASATTQDGDTVQARFPLTLKDGSGFEMTIEAEPKKIVSLTLGSDEMLLGLVDKSRIAALTKYSDDSGISNVAEIAKTIPGRASLEFIEKLIALKPDLVVTDTWTDPKEVKQLRDAGIKVFEFKTPNNIDEQKKTITEIAHVVGADEEGLKLTLWMDERLKAVSDRLKALKDDQKLTVMDYGEMGSSGKGTNFDDIVTRAGLANVVSKAGMEGWPKVSKEKVIEMDPDMIILPSWYYDKNNSLEGMISTFKKDKSMATVSAVKNNRLVSVPNPHISAISQYVVLAVEDVAKTAYPDLFK